MDFIINKLKVNNMLNNIFIIGVDGLGGAGKSTVAESLFKCLTNDNYNVSILHLDDFIHTRAIRYTAGLEEWDCYYNLQWRYDYLVDEILKPIKEDNQIDKMVELYDKDSDTYNLHKMSMQKGSILIVEGVFLQREELREYFDFVIYIDISKTVRLDRVLKRDIYIGEENQIRCKYERRYFPAEDKYFQKYRPVEIADYIIRFER